MKLIVMMLSLSLPEQTVSQSSLEVDIIALSLQERGTRYARKLLRMAKERNIYFEVRPKHVFLAVEK